MNEAKRKERAFWEGFAQRAYDLFQEHMPRQEYDECDACSTCGGEGIAEYIDCPEAWGEDCPSEVNHLINCPECEQQERWRLIDFNRELAEILLVNDSIGG